MTALYAGAVRFLSLNEAKALGEKLEELGASATSLNETDETTGQWEVIGYFDSQRAAKAVFEMLGWANEVARVPDLDWVKRSLEGLAPVAAGRFFLHGAHDRARRRAGGVSLEIDAGTAFGTGHHGTTLGCLLTLDRLLKQARPRRVLDLGCGTGVLALAAARALRRGVTASDIDAEAVRVAGINAARNGAGPLLRLIRASGLDHPALRRGATYDLIFANILARPLVGLARHLVPMLRRGGVLILSGLTREQERWVGAAYRNRGLIPVSAIRLGSWSTLSLAKKKSARRSGRSLRCTKPA